MSYTCSSSSSSGSGSSSSSSSSSSSNSSNSGSSRFPDLLKYSDASAIEKLKFMFLVKGIELLVTLRVIYVNTCKYAHRLSYA